MHGDSDGQCPLMQCQGGRAADRLVRVWGCTKKCLCCLHLIQRGISIMHIATGYSNSLIRRREGWAIVDIDIPAACRNTTFHVRDHGGRMSISGGIRHNIVQRIENWPIVIAVTYMDVVRMSAVSSKSYKTNGHCKILTFWIPLEGCRPKGRMPQLSESVIGSTSACSSRWGMTTYSECYE